MTKKGCIIYGLMLMLLILVILGLEIFLFMFLWNWLMPIFWHNAPELTFLQAFGIMVLIDIIGSLLFKRSYERNH